jgi:putative FmdB family regulatory protein
MPNFTYLCDECKRDVVLQVPIAERDEPKRPCPECGSHMLSRKMEAPPTVWRGNKSKGYNNSLRD